MTETSGSSAAGEAPKELILTRILGAPRGLAFKVWTDAKHLAEWWGPRKFTNPVCEIDARPGGLIRIDMRGPDGMIYPMKGVFHEVVEPERLVFTSTALRDEQGHPLFEILNTVTFEDFHGITKIDVAREAGHSRLQDDATGRGGTFRHGTGLERESLPTRRPSRPVIFRRVIFEGVT